MHSTREKLQRRAARIRTKLRQQANGRVRLSVNRSHKNISAQLIDDIKGHTIASASTLEKDAVKGKNGVESAANTGKLLAERALKEGVSQAIFDRGGYRFHGRVKALADAAREAGLKF